MIKAPASVGLALLLSASAAASVVSPVVPIASAPPVAGPWSAMVVTVQLLAPPGTDLSGLDDLLAQSPGQPLSRTAVQRTVQLLDETGRFDNVLAYTQPLPGGVALLIQLIPRLRITALGFHGNSRFSDEELRQKSGLRAGDEFVHDRVQASAVALEEAYRRAGYSNAQVTWDSAQSTTQAQVEFQIEEGLPLRVRQVEITGQAALPLDQLRATLGLEEGSIVDQDAIDEGLRRLAKLYRSQGRYAAQVGPVTVRRLEGEQADLSLPVRAGPVFEFAFRGNQTFSARTLRQALEYEGEEPFDEALSLRLIDRLRDFYRHQGFLFADVQVRSERTSELHVREVFEIHEDRPFKVVKLELLGTEGLGRAALKAEFHSEVVVDPGIPFFGRTESAEIDAIGVSGRPAVPAPEAYRPDPEIYVADTYAQAVARLADHYREEGFLSARVAPPRLDIDLRRHEVSVRIDVQEGVRTRLERLVFSGNDSLSEADLVRLSGLEIGQPLARSALERSRKALLRGLAKRAQPFARVEASQQIDATGQFAVLRYQLHEGPEVRIGRILFRGNGHTRDSFLRQNLGLVPGDLYDSDALLASQQRLQQLGIFDQVQIALLEPEIAEPIKDILVTLHERHPESIVAGPGFSLIEGPRASVEYTHVNLLGRAILFQAELKLNYFPLSYLELSNPTGSLVLEGLPPAQALTGRDNFFGFGGRLNAVLTDPRLFRLGHADGVLRLETLVEQVDRPYYSFSRAAILPGLQLVFGRKLNFGFQFDLERDQINTYWANLDEVFSRLSFADLTNLRFPEGYGITGSIGPSVSYDLRDDPVNPHRGLAATLKGNWVYGFFAPSGGGTGQTVFGGALPDSASGGTLPIDLFAASGSVAGYLPVGPVVLALSVKGGQIFPVGNSFVIPTQRFYLGGPDSDRGFQIDMMLPQDVRMGLHRDVALCAQSASGASCSTAGQILRSNNQLPSPGGEVFENLRGEVRFPVFARVVDGAVFLDAGNLWSDPRQFDLFALRPAAGIGVRVPTPIGPAAFDIGFNLDPDWVVNESLVQAFLSIGLF